MKAMNFLKWFQAAGAFNKETQEAIAELEELQTKMKNLSDENMSLYNLIYEIRKAVGDEGKMMQDELVEHIKKINTNQKENNND